MAVSPTVPTHGGDRLGVPRSRAEYIRTCEHVRKLVERRGWATAEEINEVWPARGKSAAEWEWAFCWAQLCRFQERGNLRQHASSEKRDRVAARIIAREPVYVQVAGRTVGLTSRGLFSMIRLARHDMARREIADALQDVADAAAETEERRMLGQLSRTAARRRAKHLRQLHDALHDQLLFHTQTVLANALTADGGDVKPEHAGAWLDEHAPWANRVTPAELLTILAGLFSAGPMRHRELGDPPPSGRKRERDWNEDFGFWSLISYFSREHGIEPASIMDVTQLLTMARAGAPYIPPPDERKNAPPGPVH